MRSIEAVCLVLFEHVNIEDCVNQFNIAGSIFMMLPTQSDY